MTDAEIAALIAGLPDRASDYDQQVMGFLAIDDGAGYRLIQAKIAFAAGYTDLGPTQIDIFRTPKVFAGIVPLSSVASSIDKLLRSLQEGELHIEGQQVIFPLESNGKASFYRALHPTFLNSGKYVESITVRGGQLYALPNRGELDAHLKTGVRPFDSLEDLWSTFGVDKLDLGSASVELIFGVLVDFDAGSVVKGDLAELAVFAPKSLDRGRVRLGYRVLNKGAVTLRGAVDGDKLAWSHTANGPRGACSLTVPAGAAVECFASYKDAIQTQGLASNPEYAGNPRRVAFADFDPELEVLKEYLFDSSTKDRSRDLEAGVAWLFWLLGFSVLHLSAKRLSENVDVVAATPRGKVLMIECTTGLLSREGKLQKLLYRKTRLHEKFVKAGVSGQVHAVAVIQKPATEISDDAKEAAQKGVHVLTREDLQRAVEASTAPHDADAFVEWLLERSRSRLATFGAGH